MSNDAPSSELSDAELMAAWNHALQNTRMETGDMFSMFAAGYKARRSEKAASGTTPNGSDIELLRDAADFAQFSDLAEPIKAALFRVIGK